MQAAPGLQAEGTPSSKTSCQYLREIHQQIDLLRHQVESLTDFKRGYFQIEFLAVPNNQHAADLPSVGSPPSHMVENHLLQYDASQSISSYVRQKRLFSKRISRRSYNPHAADLPGGGSLPSSGITW